MGEWDICIAVSGFLRLELYALLPQAKAAAPWEAKVHIGQKPRSSISQEDLVATCVDN